LQELDGLLMYVDDEEEYYAKLAHLTVELKTTLRALTGSQSGNIKPHSNPTPNRNLGII
jgi:hypothetical protein